MQNSFDFSDAHHPDRSALDALLAFLKQKYNARICAQVVIPAAEPEFADFPREIDDRLTTAFRSRGIEKLYTHQRQAWASATAGDSTVIVTPTASGKSICYNLPVLQSVLLRQGKALYLFPTKALSQDQVAELHELTDVGDLGVRVGTFDGDTPKSARMAVRTDADIVVTNPDMLHVGILPHHTKWARFFESLRFVVVDELHVYRGVFGAHVANVIRRLKRICNFYGSNPVFILCSATIGNAGELAERLIGERVQTISKSGAPRGEKHLILWNPPVTDADFGIRESAESQTVVLTANAVASGLKSIVFTLTRLAVEVLTKTLTDRLEALGMRSACIRGYRGGYLPIERREVERALRNGKIDCVIATMALELGVDIGSLDVAILNGYPGTIAGAWQRFGRAGRRIRPSLAILIGSNSPIDQYIMRHPEFLVGASPECAHVDPNQAQILVDHVRCAAFELPFTEGDRFGGQDIAEALTYLEEQRALHREGNRWHWIAEDYPAATVNLRTVAKDNFLVVDTTNGANRVIAEVDHASAAAIVYEGAVYMVQTESWQVERLDWTGRKASVHAIQADYYTEAIQQTHVGVVNMQEHIASGFGGCAKGDVRVVRQVVGYKKLRFGTHENLGYGPVNLPSQTMPTTAVWWTVSRAMLEDVHASLGLARESLEGAAYVLHVVSTLLAMCELHDLGRALGNTDVGAPAVIEHKEPDSAIFLYDNYPQGIGLSSALFRRKDEIISRAQELVRGCLCANGCPSCIGPALEDPTKARKTATVGLLSLFAGGKEAA